MLQHEICKEVAKHNPQHKDGYDHLVYVLQGGGALGAFQFGAYQALYQANYRPTWICGISIGAINAAIIAGNPPENRVAKLAAFWKNVAIDTGLWSLFNTVNQAKIHGSMSAQLALLYGIPNFCKPNFINPWFIHNAPPDQISFYDTSELRKSIEELVDFNYLNQHHVRLSLGAVNVSEGAIVYFDNTKQTLTVDHILASCALPPAFPAVKIGDDYYWDGGVYANSPLCVVLPELGDESTLCILIDNFSAKGVLPHSLDGILEREKDIHYSSRSKRQTQLHMTQYNLRKAISELGKLLTKEQLKSEQVQNILNLGFVGHLHIAHIIYHSPTGKELHSKDYEFSTTSIQRRIEDGFQHACRLLQAGRTKWLEQIQSNERIIFTQEEDELILTTL
ncbi:MAG: patatin-like phospholipase family protein [Legionellales bacterium]|nr:patatin-like phospholipase family protein [Legionellales bacterium]